MELHQEIRQLLGTEVTFDVYNVERTWTKIYGDWSNHENGPHMCVNVLACFAVQYENWGMVEELLFRCSPYCPFSPFITAVHSKEAYWVMFVKKCMYTYFTVMTYRDKRELYCSYLSAKGYGIIIDDQLLVTEQTSPLHIALQNDKAFLMIFFFSECYLTRNAFQSGVLAPVVDMARGYNATKCLKKLSVLCKEKFHPGANFPLVQLSHAERARKLENLIDFSLSFHGLTTPLHYLSAMYLWTSLDKSFHTTRLISTAEEDAIQQFVTRARENLQANIDQAQHVINAVEADRSVETNKNMNNRVLSTSSLLPLSLTLPSSSLEPLYHRVMMENCTLLLNSIVATENKYIQSKAFCLMLEKVQNIIECLQHINENVSDGCCNSLHLHNQMLKLFLQSYAVQYVGCKNCTHVTGCSCANSTNAYGHALSDIFGTYSSYLDSFHLEAQHAGLLRVCEYICEFFRILLAHGYTKATKSIAEKKNLAVRFTPFLALGNVCISMMQHDVYEFYRLKTIRGQGLSAVRSLQELCRLKLHEILPHGKVPHAVHHLPLPKMLKDFLSLGVKLL